MECVCGNICQNDDICFICEDCHEDIQFEAELEREHMKKLPLIYFCSYHMDCVRHRMFQTESQIVAWRYSMGFTE